MLRIEINEEYSPPKFCQGSTKVDRCCGFPNTTFLVNDRDDDGIAVRLLDRRFRNRWCLPAEDARCSGYIVVIKYRFSAQSRNLSNNFP